jgi:hypothetical protein
MVVFMDLATAVTAVRTAVDRLSRVDAEAGDVTGLRNRPPAQPAPPPVPALRADLIGGNASVAPARSVDQLTLV